jgi:hypothetical protein
MRGKGGSRVSVRPTILGDVLIHTADGSYRRCKPRKWIVRMVD